MPARSRTVRVGAATDKDEQKSETPKFSFSANKRAALGYLESDSAGQENIFAVQPPQYVEGSVRDVNSDASANTVIAAGGAFLGLVAVAAGAVALLNLGAGGIDDSQFVPLSEYSAKFSAELEAPSP